MIGINNLFNLFNNKYLANDILTVVTSHEFVITHSTVRGVYQTTLKLISTCRTSLTSFNIFVFCNTTKCILTFY
jgi:hypothetical protein